MVPAKTAEATGKRASELKMFSYSDVEKILYEMLHQLNCLEIMKENGIEIAPGRTYEWRGVNMIIKQDDRAYVWTINLEEYE